MPATVSNSCTFMEKSNLFGNEKKDVNSLLYIFIDLELETPIVIKKKSNIFLFFLSLINVNSTSSFAWTNMSRCNF